MINSFPRIIAIEGIAGTGKTTLIDRLEKELGYKCINEFPNNFADGFLTRKAFCSTPLALHNVIQTPIAQTLMLAANAAFKAETTIKTESETTPFVIFDRYIDSVIAYQNVLLRRSGISYNNLFYEFFQKTIRSADMVIFLECPRQVIEERLCKRGSKVDEEYVSFLQEVNKEYTHIFLGRENVVQIDAGQSADSLYKAVVGTLSKNLHSPLRGIIQTGRISNINPCLK